MEIRFFTEKYDPEFGSVFKRATTSVLADAEFMDWCDVTEPISVFNNMADFRDDEGYRAFEDTLKRADKVIIFGKDGIYPGDLVNIYQIVIQ